jgi:hypothetical protein
MGFKIDGIIPPTKFRNLFRPWVWSPNVLDGNIDKQNGM